MMQIFHCIESYVLAPFLFVALCLFSSPVRLTRERSRLRADDKQRAPWPRRLVREVRLAPTTLSRVRASKRVSKRVVGSVAKDVGGRQRKGSTRWWRKDRRRKKEVGYVSRPKVECWPRVISVATSRAVVNFCMSRFQPCYVLQNVNVSSMWKFEFFKKDCPGT